MATNPIIGSGWGSSPSSGFQPSNLFTPAPAPNFSPIPGSPGNPGNLPNPFTNVKDATRSAAGLNNLLASSRLQAIPAFMQNLFGYGNQAGNVFGQFANLGSPFYQQKQSEAFTQGVKQGQDAQGIARQQLAAQGYGGTPSGATAAMIGSMNQAQGSSLAEQYLQQLFNNENLSLQGAQGLAGIASLFNPAQLFGNISAPGSTQGPSAAESFNQIMSGIFGSSGGLAAFHAPPS